MSTVSEIKQCLIRMIEQDAVCNSLLFAGPRGAGKREVAEVFAKMLVATEELVHPDIRIYRPEGKIGMHSIESMRQLTEEVYRSPYQAKWKVFIIHEADRMLPTSANALLKTFEEPGLQSVLILLTSSPERLLPTVLSRCRTLYFYGQSALPQSHPRLLDAFARGSLLDYRNLLQFSKELAAELEEKQEEIPKHDVKELTAAQKEAVNKEYEGAHRLSLGEDFLSLLQQILGWYRDLHLLHCKGDPKYLMHPDWQEALHTTLQRGHLLPLEYVQEEVCEAKLAFERSTSVQICLENLFLKLCQSKIFAKN